MRKEVTKMKKRIFALVIAILTLSLIVCASVVAASASEEAPTVSIDRFNLTFESDTYIKYAVKFDGIDESQITRANTGMLYWTEPQTSYVIGSESSSSEIIGYTTIDGEKYYTFAYDKFAAKQMTDYIYSVAYVIADGEYYYSAPVKYSILTYAYDKLGYIGTATESEALKDMLVNLLEYGAAAQKHFGYRTDHLADEQYYQVTVEGGTLEDGFTTGLYLDGESVTVTAPELSKNSVPFVAWVDAHGTEISTKYESDITAVAENSTYTATYADDGLVYTLQTDDTYSVTGYTATTTSVIIPCTYEGKAVTNIGESAFSNCTEICSVEIPDSVTWISPYAFSGCSSITNIKIPDSVRIIYSYAFSGCSNLTSIDIPDSVTTMGAYLFSGCSNLTSIIIPDSVLLINQGMFYDCVSLSNVVIPNSVYRLGPNLFCGCTSLTSVVIPDSVDSIGDGMFSGCTSLTSVEIGDSVTSIGVYAFDGCSSLTSVVIPDSVTSIDEWAFNRCSGLTSVVLGDSVASIGRYAFDYCSSLTSIVIPDSITSIGDEAFYDCISLKDIYYTGNVEGWCNISFGPWRSNPMYLGENLYFDGELVTEIVIPDTVTQINDYAFYGCDNLTSVVIGDSVTSIGGWAFRDCANLTSVVIGDSVTSIGGSAFYNCDSLTSIVIPDGVTSIGHEAFRDCDGLTIYCEAESQPDNWASDWNPDNRPVVWGYKG